MLQEQKEKRKKIATREIQIKQRFQQDWLELKKISSTGIHYKT